MIADGSIHSFVLDWVATRPPCMPRCCSPYGWECWRSADALSLTDQLSAAQTPPTFRAPLGLCRCKPGGQRHLEEEMCHECQRESETDWWGSGFFCCRFLYTHGVSSSGRKVTVAVSCLMTLRISSWMALMDFSLGTLRNARRFWCTMLTMEWITTVWQNCFYRTCDSTVTQHNTTAS